MRRSAGWLASVVFVSACAKQAGSGDAQGAGTAAVASAPAATSATTAAADAGAATSAPATAAPATGATGAATTADAGPASADGGQANADGGAADAAPPKPVSHLADAEALLSKEFLAKDAVAMADSVASEATPAAAVAGARLRLAAVALATMQKAGAEALGEGGFEKQLRLALAAAEKAGDQGKTAALAARALLTLPSLVEKAAAETAPSTKELRALYADGSLEATAFRVAAAQELLTQTSLIGPGAFERFLATDGALLCDGCRAAGTLPPEQLGELVKKAWDDGGLTCAPDTKTPVCAALANYGKDAGQTPPAPNTLAVAWLSLADALRKAPDAGPLVPAFRPLGETVLGPTALPVPVAGLDEAWGATGLGRGDIREEQAALLVAKIDPVELRIGGRPVVKVDGTSWTADAGVKLEDAPAVTIKALLATKPDKKTGEVAGVSDRVAAVGTKLSEAPGKAPSGAPGDANAIVLAADPATPVGAVARLAEGLAASKLALRVLRPKTAGAVLPLWTGEVPLELKAKLVPSWERATLVEVREGHIDIWCADKAKDGAAPIKADRQAGAPGFAKQAWRGETLVRLRVPLPKRDKGAPFALAPDVIDQVAQAVRYFAHEAHTGLLVDLVASPDLPVGPVLELAHVLQEDGGETKAGEGPSLSDVAENGGVWPGTGCDVGKKDCATSVVVAFSKAGIPSGAGLSDKPGKKSDKPEKPEVVKGPEPSPEFCNKADIQVQMKKKAGDFRFCYERELQLEKTLQGRLGARFTIDMQGHVKTVSAGGDLPSPKVADCIKKTILKITFAPPVGGECVVNWPFVFKF